MMRRLSVYALLGLTVVALASQPAAAQQRPLATQDPETIGGGRILVEGGLDYTRDNFFPASGLTGNLLRLPLIGVSVGLSSIAEIQLTGGLYNRLSITGRQPAPLSYMLDVTGNTTDDVEDLVLATKIRVASETASRPAFGVRFATRLPNAGNESGLGLDTTDFFVSALVAKTFHSTRIVGNVGLGILGDPARGDRQNDVLTYGVSIARALTNAIEVVGEVNGRANTRTWTVDPPPGTEGRSMLRVGARYSLGAGRFDAAVLFGLTAHDPGIGVAFGYTHVFNAFKIP
jgi:hypothetical protein